MLIPMGDRMKAGGYYSMQICPALIESGRPSLLKAYSRSFWALPLKYHYLLLRGESLQESGIHVTGQRALLVR